MFYITLGIILILIWISMSGLFETIGKLVLKIFNKVEENINDEEGEK